MVTWEKTRQLRVVVVGSALAGLGAFAYVLLTTRNLGLEGFKPISQLWTVWAIAAAVVTFSGQIVTVRREVLLGRTSIPKSAELLPLLLLILVVVPVLFGYRSRIFGEPHLIWPVVGVLIPFGSYVTGRARGWLAVHGSPFRLAAVVAGENLVRATLAALLGLLHAGAIWYALAILAGYSVALIGLWRHERASRPVAVNPGTTDRLIPLSASAAGIGCHVLLVAAPTVLAASGGDAAVVSALFVAMAVYRAPYQLVLGVIPVVARVFTLELPRMSDLEVTSLARKAVVAVIALSGLAAATGWLLGEPVVAAIFGAERLLDPVDYALAGVLTIVATGALVGSVGLLAKARTAQVISVWGVVTMLTLSWASVVGTNPTTILSAMTLGLTVAMLGVGLPFIRPHRDAVRK